MTVGAGHTGSLVRSEAVVQHDDIAGPDPVEDALNKRLVLEKKDSEITFLFAASAILLLLASALLSLLWFNRVL